MFSAARRLGGVAAVSVLVTVAAGCGGGGPRHSSSVLAVSSLGWTGGKQLGSHGLLGACATSTGPHKRTLIVCRSASSAAFKETCWSAHDQASIANGSWEDDSADPNCDAAQLAAQRAGLFALSAPRG